MQLRDVTPPKRSPQIYTLRFRPASPRNERPGYRVYLSDSQRNASLYTAIIVAMNMDSPTPADAGAGGTWSRTSPVGMDDLILLVDMELMAFNFAAEIADGEKIWI